MLSLSLFIKLLILPLICLLALHAGEDADQSTSRHKELFIMWPLPIYAAVFTILHSSSRADAKCPEPLCKDREIKRPSLSTFNQTLPATTVKVTYLNKEWVISLSQALSEPLLFLPNYINMTKVVLSWSFLLLHIILN